MRLNALNGSIKLAGEDQGGSEAPVGEIAVQLERCGVTEIAAPPRRVSRRSVSNVKSSKT
jgi:hypothetical protein